VLGGPIGPAHDSAVRSDERLAISTKAVATLPPNDPANWGRVPSSAGIGIDVDGTPQVAAQWPQGRDNGFPLLNKTLAQNPLSE